MKFTFVLLFTYRPWSVEELVLYLKVLHATLDTSPHESNVTFALIPVTKEGLIKGIAVYCKQYLRTYCNRSYTVLGATQFKSQLTYWLSWLHFFLLIHGWMPGYNRETDHKISISLKQKPIMPVHFPPVLHNSFPWDLF